MSPETNPYKRPLWPMIVLAVCALGAGISGTLLWTQSRAAKTVVAIAPASEATAPTDALPPIVNNVPKPSAPAVAQPIVPENAPDPNAPFPPNLAAGLSAPQAALARGNWFFDHQNWPRAIAEYQTAIQSGIDNPNIRTDLGSAYRFAKQPGEAIKQYQIAQKQDPNHENSLFNQGGTYALSMGQTTKGIAKWKEYLKRFPNGESAAAARQLLQQAEMGKPAQQKT